MKSFRQTHPLELVERLILLEQIHKLKVKDLRAFMPEVVSTLEETVDGDDEVKYILVVDWEKLLFDTPIVKLQKLMCNFEPHKPSSIITQ
jgi:hypothetical protein